MKKERYIFESKDGRYLRVQIRVGDNQFSKNVRIADYPTKARAMAAAKLIRDKALQERARNILVTHTPTVGEIYERTPELYGYTKKTVIRHDYYYKVGIVKYENVEIKDITTADVMKSVAEYAKDHSDLAVERLVSLWSIIFETAQMMDIPVPNRAKVVRANMPKAQKPVDKRKTYASDEDIHKFLDTIQTYGTHTPSGRCRARKIFVLAIVMLHTGCRPAEALALTRTDINLTNRTIYFSKSIGSTSDESGRQVKAAKTTGSVREVPIDDKLNDVLIEYLCCRDMVVTDLLFPDKHGCPMEIRNVDTYIRNVCKKAGVHVTLYMLRHKFSTDMLKIADIRTVQDLMGHESPSMTLSYARSTPDDRKEAIDKRKLS